MSDKKGSGLDIFDSLEKKDPQPSDSGVVPRSLRESKAPPPPPSMRPSGAKSLAPPNLAQLSAPISRGSAPPPPPSLRPPAPPPAPMATLRSMPPPAPPPTAPSSLRAPPPPPPAPEASVPSIPLPPMSRPMTPRNSTPPPPPPPTYPSSPLPRPPAVPSGALSAYAGDAEDDLPTRLYSPGSVPPPAPQATVPRNERPAPYSGPTQKIHYPKPQQSSKVVLYSAIAGIAVIGLLAFLLMGRTGSVTVTVTGPGGRALEGVRVFIDGIDRCDKSPCRIHEVKAGAHFIRATAQGYQDTADQAVSIEGGSQTTHNISMVPAGEGTGLRVSALGSGLKLFVDGQELGELPQTAKNLTPGEHAVRVAGNDRYEAWEEKVRLDDGEMRSLGPLKLKVIKGLATFKPGPGADGARVLLDGRLVPELPSTIEVPAGKQLTLVATKTGYSTFRRAIEFEDGVAEKTFEITMVEGTDDGSPAALEATQDEPAPTRVASKKGSAAKGVPAAPAPKKGAAPASAPPVSTPAASGDKAILKLSATPPANVIVNGRPIGQTPKAVRVAPGPQTVVFFHPQFGRKVMSATVAAGETKSLTAKMK